MVMKATTQPETRTIAAGEFKAKCLKLMDDAVVTQQAFTITKRGKPVGQFVPTSAEKKPFYSVVGRSPNAKILGDIISPLPQEWTLPEWLWEKPAKRVKKAKKK
jgi:PHD/YefM family antitoxin component YafN of YafNO toxin-antitoxin module